MSLIFRLAWLSITDTPADRPTANEVDSEYTVDLVTASDVTDTSPDDDDNELVPLIVTSDFEVVTATPTSRGDNAAKAAKPCFDRSVLISVLPSMEISWPAVREELSISMLLTALRASKATRIPPE